ncbi:MAG TPA: urate hydroxylase PuuD [Verrucomicrobiae bacterium]|nr:urate hydroxylase PuuD [Verrucomicrobiae bacterium]
MDFNFNEWLELILRWAHVFAGIMWVGATFYFTWLDGRFTELEKKASDGTDAEKFVWMVHSGGFYQVEKQKRPKLMPSTLHWFRWEAALTWLTGFLLFAYMYYHGPYLVSSEDSLISKGAAIGLSLGMLIAGWVAYDLVWRFCKQEMLGMVICYALIVGAAWVACHYFTGRGAYLQVGAMMGTIMAANVWMGILPAQRRMVAALKEGREPDLTEGARAKARSKHNTFIVIPVVFTMISNHYPGTYGSKYNWLILSTLVLVGWVAAKIIRRA